MTVPRWQAAGAPKPLRGFEGINRYWDAADGRWVAQVLPGDFYVTRDDEVIATVLGSCVSTCIRDEVAGIGGLNHFMLPYDPGGDSGGQTLRYGCFAIERLLNVLVKFGAERERMEIKIFGGGRVINAKGDVGASNIAFVRDYFETEGLEIGAEDLGGNVARRVRYYPATGKVLLKQLETNEAKTVIDDENKHRVRLSVRPPAGEIELF